MKLTPIDIAHKTFGRKFLGVNEDEVTEFLRMVADQVEALVRERNKM